MATCRKRANGWEFQVRPRGRKSVTRTFRVKADGQAWAAGLENEYARGIFRDRSSAERYTVGSLLRRYRDQVTPLKKSAVQERLRIDALLRDPLAQIRAADLRPQDLANFRDERLAKVTGSTVLRDLTLLSHVFNVARKEWSVQFDNPCSAIRRPKENRPRKRRLAPWEEFRLLHELQPSQRLPDGTWTPGGTRNPWVHSLVIVAVETAMRRGEMLALEWRDVFLDQRFVRLHDSKNGEGRDVPLSMRAYEVLSVLTRAPSGRVFPVSEEAVKRCFTRAAKRAGLSDLHFHDLRHEATSRIAPKINNLLELSLITGHKDLKMLKRYYHPSASELALKLG